ncbi:hypothetical protein [Labrenzia sp. OB1]|uniref:hypothetical protein n=1 Tax=Labrenzia sp. OB1 TaxID=1561204 RepID=UPI0007B24A47|nr:hypothetical protein [Labrenzia sp. OB1]KZM47996.1 hypothetical protein OA90_22505 [Labrenzia sp. OB1]
MSAENTLIFKSVAYSGGVILGGWGLIEIFLRVDPFYALFLRDLDSLGWIVAGVASTLFALHLFPGPLKLEGDPTRRRRLGFAVVGGLVCLLASWGAGTIWSGIWMVAHANLGGAVLFQGTYFLTGILLALAIACWACPAVPEPTETEPANIWPHWLGIPVIFATAVVAIMLLLVSNGRVSSLMEGDIAQEELRRGGLEFSMTSLQEALYLISPRSVELFRKANVNDGDILGALSAPTSFTGEEPLITSILSRIDGGNDLICNKETLGSSDAAKCNRIDAFIRLFRTAPEPRWFRQIFRDKNDVASLCFSKTEESRARARATANEVVSGLDSATERSLCERISDEISVKPSDGAPPRPIVSYAVSGGHTNVAQCILSLCNHPGTDIEIRPASNDPQIDTTFGPSQSHIRFAIDPYWAVDHIRSSPNSPWTSEEADQFKRFLREIVKIEKSRNLLQETSEKLLQETLNNKNINNLPKEIAAEKLSPIEAQTRPSQNVFVEHDGDRCNTRRFELLEINEGKLHDNTTFSNVYLRFDSDGEVIRGNLFRHRASQTRLVYERQVSGQGNRLAVLDKVANQNTSSLLVGLDTSILLGTRTANNPNANGVFILKNESVQDFSVGEAPVQTNRRLKLELTGQIVLTGHPENDLCIELLNEAENRIASFFIPRAPNFSVETPILKAGTYDLRVTALKKDTSTRATDIKVSVRSSLFCSKTQPNMVSLFQSLPDTQVELAPFRAEEIEGDRLYCPFRTTSYSQLTIEAATQVDAAIRLVESQTGTQQVNNVDIVDWVDNSSALDEDDFSREFATAILFPERNYVLEVKPYKDGELESTRVAISFTQGPQVSQAQMRAAVEGAQKINSNTSSVLTLVDPAVGAVRSDDAGLFEVNSEGDVKIYKLDVSSGSSFADGSALQTFETETMASLNPDVVLIGLATSQTGGSVAVDPLASRPFPLEETVDFPLLQGVSSDMHLVEPSSDGRLEVTLAPTDADLDLTLRSETGTIIDASENTGTQVDTVYIDAEKGKAFVVEVSSLGDDSAYQLHAAGWEWHLRDAMPLNETTNYRHEPLGNGESKRFRYTASQTGSLKVSLRPTTGDLDLVVLTEDWADQLSSENEGTETDEVSLQVATDDELLIQVDALAESAFMLSATYQ